MEDLHVAITAHLRGQRRQVTEIDGREAAILNIWRGHSVVSRCKICGATIDSDEDELYNLADMQAVRECRDHYTPF